MNIDACLRFRHVTHVSVASFLFLAGACTSSSSDDEEESTDSSSTSDSDDNADEGSDDSGDESSSDPELPVVSFDCAGECGGDEDCERTCLEGYEVYAKRVEDGNTFSCSTCHALTEPTEDEITRPGHPIGDAIRRPSFKNGQLNEMRLAANTCLDEWMGAEPWEEDNENWTKLSAFMELVAGEDESEAIEFEIVQPPEDLSGGDSVAGREVFNKSCVVCHAQDGTGSQLAPAITGLGLSPDLIARRVRTSGRTDSAVYDDLTGGRMPFWSASRLSDQQLLDIIAYVGLDEEELPSDNGEGGEEEDSGAGTGDSGGNDNEGRECGTDHERIGWVADFVAFAHGVAGRATIVDECTVEVEMFNYDGQGINVQFYGAPDGDFEESGFSMSGDLRGDPYVNATVTATIPEGTDLDDLDGISVWCVPIGIDFGSGSFSAP